MNKRILAMLLAMIMVIGMVPITALAATHTGSVDASALGAGDYVAGGTLVLNNSRNSVTVVFGTSSSTIRPGNFESAPEGYWEVSAIETATNQNQDRGPGGNNRQGTTITFISHTHTLNCINNTTEQHTVVCECGYEVTESHIDADGDCVCDTCNGAMPHNLTEVKWKAATCTENGNWTHWVCSTCKGTFTDATGTTVKTDVVIPATGHKNDNGWSCDDNAHYERCDVCGEVMSDETGHSFTYTSNDAQTHNATCTVCDRVVENLDHNFGDDCTCDDCGYTEHSLELFSAQDPTCTEAGWQWHYECSTCGKYFWDEGAASETTFEAVTLAATDHNNTNGLSCDDEYHWEQCDNEGCTAVIGEKIAHTFEYKSNGEQTHNATCTVCGRVVKKLDHNFGDDCTCDDCGYTNHSLKWVAGVQPTCTENGMKGHWECEKCGLLFANDTEKTNVITEKELVKLATGHTAGEWGGDKTNHWKVCTVEGCEDPATTPEAHTFGAYRDNGDGTHRAWCSTCGAWVNFDHVDENADCVCDLCEVMIHEHTTPVFVRAKAATCTAAGTGAYWHWKGCDVQMFDVDTNERISSIATTPATGHDWTGAWRDAGNGTHVKTCANSCGETQTVAHVNLNGDCYCDDCGAALHSHEVVAVAEVPATCTNMGTAAYWYYEGCGTMFSDEACTQRIWAVQYTPSTGHDWSSGWVNNARDDNHVKACLNGCGALQYAEHTMEVEDPLKGNYHQYICECGATETEIHYDDDGDGECDECAHDMNGTAVEVIQHDSVTVTRTAEEETEEEKPERKPGQPGTNNSRPAAPQEKPDSGNTEEVKPGTPVTPPTRPGASQGSGSNVIDEEFITQNYDRIIQLLQQMLNNMFNK